jgi:transposase
MMLNLSPGIKIYVYTPVTDMRKGFNGLSGIVRSEFGADPADGSLFVFINRRRDRMKILHFDGGGFWLYYRLLEAGTFEELKGANDLCRLQIDATQLSMLLSGVSLVASRRRRKRYSEKRSEQAA